MSEALTNGPGNIAGVSASGLLLSCLALVFSSLVSHTVTLFPYLVKLVSFLGPLFFTTFLVLLALLTLSPSFIRGEMSEPGLSSIMGACSSLLNQFRTNANEVKGGFEVYEGSEVYRIIFEAPGMESSPYGSGNKELEPPVDKFLIYGDNAFGNGSLPRSKREEKKDCPVEEIVCPNVEPGKKLGALFMEKLWCEAECSEEMEVVAKVKAEDENSEKVVDEEKQVFHDSESELTKESEAKINDGDVDTKNNNPDTIFGRKRQGSRRFGESSSRVYGNVLGGGELDRNLGSFGSMSRSVEWKRTLACKLFEERRNSEGEGMDSLWETYEDDASKKGGDKMKKEKKAIKRWKKERVDSKISVVSNKVQDEDDSDEVDGDEVGMDGKLCCLQALRLSAGRKMGMGMGIKPNIVRMSKAFKGMSWLYHHQVVSHGHGSGKKG
ncbi:hypothetical protein MLD38_032923 [Melastoma candidum]|uniref:Uncharacterized protein n=1 Tax=Melastoma candidum TaxID=119954 RepID=A0ACB9M7E0_9MYRT|nr:hypothetical protein MLD38_032923 [Melastoma candidum]